jgi:two-component system sensor histidine kinase KdpD
MPADEAEPRPDPIELLAQVRREERAARRGKLRIFFGAAPGVGKTYAMLSAAQRLAREGADVVVGVAETHGRAETEQKLAGLEVLPRRAVEYRGTKLTEFDLDAALQRRPAVLVLDELAHTNAPGSRFAKRWQDARELLEAGISVFTTLNVQHVESLNDVVAQITGVTVRETVPDAVVEEADELELVDLPPDALLERLHQGKVYVPQAIRAAVGSFFRKGNLTALRELALRRTAEWVDVQLLNYKRDQRIKQLWPAADRMVVAVGPSPLSRTLVRAARRMAAGLRAEMIAAFVERPSRPLSPAASERVMQTLRLAESLGAETAVLSGEDAAAELVAFARARHANRIVVGKTGRTRLRERLFGSFVGDLLRQSGEIDVYVIRREAEPEADATEARGGAAPQARDTVAGWVPRACWTLAIVAACTALARLVSRPPDLSEELMILLLGVVLVARRFGRYAAVLAAFLSVGAGNYFFTEPYHTFVIDDPASVVALAVMLFVALIVATLTGLLREQTEAARERERTTSALYSVARGLTGARDRDEVAAVAARHARETFGRDALMLVPDSAGGRLRRIATSGSPDWFDEREQGVARWAFDHGKAAGIGTTVLPASAGHYVPLLGNQGKVGVLALRPQDDAPPDARRQLLLDTFANQVALAMERVLLLEGRQAARLEAESERLRSSLLSAVSHDLRTPLASIAGAAGALLAEGEPMAEETRRELLRGIDEEARRLGDLVASIVFATRLRSGGIQLQREWTTIEDIVGAGLARLRDRLGGRSLHTSIEAGLPLVRADTATMAQVVHNLVDNARRHTPPGSTIDVTATATDTHVLLQIADDGPGLPADVVAGAFERPFEPGQGSSRPGAGMGLGLWICGGIVKAHGGRIQVENRVPHGALFTITLSIDRPQPDLPEPDREVSA